MTHLERLRAELARVNALELKVMGLDWPKRAKFRERRRELWEDLRAEEKRIEEANAER